MFDKLEFIHRKGYRPDTILDIGAYHGKWTDEMSSIFTDSTFHLFEAINYPELAEFNNVHNVLLNDKKECVNWYQMKNTGDSMFKENSKCFDNCEVIQRESIDLDTYISNNNLLQDSKNIFIKIDCQGAEIPILKGATSILDRTDFILLEVPLFGQYNAGVPSFSEHILFMESIGFVIYDVVECHFINGFNMQVDVVFINKKHPYNTEVNNLTF